MMLILIIQCLILEEPYLQLASDDGSSRDDATVDYTVSDFGGNASSVVADPAGLVNNVLQSEKTQTWGGTTLGTASGFATAIPFAMEQQL